MATMEFLPPDYEAEHRDVLLGLLALADPDDDRLQGGTVVRTIGTEVTDLSIDGVSFDSTLRVSKAAIVRLHDRATKYLNSPNGFIGMFGQLLCTEGSRLSGSPMDARRVIDRSYGRHVEQTLFEGRGEELDLGVRIGHLYGRDGSIIMRGIALTRVDDQIAQELRVVEVSPGLLLSGVSRLALCETLEPAEYDGWPPVGSYKMPQGIGLPTLTELQDHHEQLRDLLSVELDIAR